MSKDALSTFVYWLKNAAGDCIYVGSTTSLERRWKEHQRRLGSEIAGVASAGPFTRRDGLLVERIEQRRLSPKYVGSIKCIPNQFTTWDLPSFECEPIWPEDGQLSADVIGARLRQATT